MTPVYGSRLVSTTYVPRYDRSDSACPRGERRERLVLRFPQHVSLSTFHREGLLAASASRSARRSTSGAIPSPPVAVLDHFRDLVRGVDVHERHRHVAEDALRASTEARAVLADGPEHGKLRKARVRLAQQMYAAVFQLVEMIDAARRVLGVACAVVVALMSCCSIPRARPTWAPAPRVRLPVPSQLGCTELRTFRLRAAARRAASTSGAGRHVHFTSRPPSRARSAAHPRSASRSRRSPPRRAPRAATRAKPAVAREDRARRRAARREQLTDVSSSISSTRNPARSASVASQRASALLPAPRSREPETLGARWCDVLGVRRRSGVSAVSASLTTPPHDAEVVHQHERLVAARSAARSKAIGWRSLSTQSATRCGAPSSARHGCERRRVEHALDALEMRRHAARAQLSVSCARLRADGCRARTRSSGGARATGCGSCAKVASSRARHVDLLRECEARDSPAPTIAGATR